MQTQPLLAEPPMNNMIGSLWPKICTLAQKGHTEFIYYLEKMAVNGFPPQYIAVM